MANHLKYLNKKQHLQRTAAGKIGHMEDTSIMTLEDASAYKQRLNDSAPTEGLQATKLHRDGLEDLTDFQNTHFIYVGTV